MSELQTFEANDSAILTYLGLNPNDAKSHAVVAVCRRYALDPLLKHVIVIPGAGVYVTRDGLLHVAHRSGQLDGIEVEDTTETQTEWSARVAVWRKDMSRPFRYSGRYSKSAKNQAHGPEMAVKCAEAHALRRAFDMVGLPVLEERDAASPASPHVETTDAASPHVETTPGIVSTRPLPPPIPQTESED